MNIVKMLRRGLRTLHSPQSHRQGEAAMYEIHVHLHGRVQELYVDRGAVIQPGTVIEKYFNNVEQLNN